MSQWWKHCVFYQIYMPSFCDGNHDGIGDFKGIQSKLGYLKALGVGCLWLTPFYPSPKVDQGYDISDYYNIDTDYGTMEDFEAFIQEAHSLGIRVISDVVINHTSTEHSWFLESQSDWNHPKRDWYIWKKPVSGQELPNNWESFFGEKAWEYDAATDMYYYHSFAKEQADLNWGNAQVKKAVFDMLDFWVEKGLDGFRLDVINNLTLTGDMRDNPYDEEGKQIHKYDINQDGIHDFMRELKTYLSRDKELLLVGEISTDNLEIIHSFVGGGQLDTTFNFNLGSMKTFRFSEFYDELKKMTDLYREDYYPTIFFGSHDMPRFPSRFNFSENQAKTLFTLMMTYRGLPFIYFGDEIGMKNYVCHSIEEARDIQGVIAYNKALEEGKEIEAALKDLNEASRDHSRNTMYWKSEKFGGFSDAEPWICFQKQPGDSAQAQMEEPDSLFCYAAKLTELRSNLEVLSLGDCRIYSPRNGVIVCERTMDGVRLWSVMNFSKKPVTIELEGAESLNLNILIESGTGVGEILGAQVWIEEEHSVIIKEG